jgi:hypothetical protein
MTELDLIYVSFQNGGFTIAPPAFAKFYASAIILYTRIAIEF